MDAVTKRVRALCLLAVVAIAGSAACAGGDSAVEKGTMAPKGGADLYGEAELGQKRAGSSAAKASLVYTAKVTAAAAAGGAEIRAGETSTGALEPSDPTLPDGSHYDEWTYTASGETEIIISLSSDEFDTYLAVGVPAGDGWNILGEDDDGAGDLNSRLEIAIPGAGTYSIITTSYAGGETGAYTLSVAENRIEWVDAGTLQGTLEESDPPLGDGSRYDRYAYRGQGGEQLTIDLQSDEFDTYLVIGQGTVGPDFSVLAEDDDGGTDYNSRLTVTLPDDGVYTIIANGYSAEDLGAYSLSITSAGGSWQAMYPGGGDPRDRYALIVGIDDYPGIDNDLVGPVEDARMMRDLLISQFGFPEENVVMITDQAASRTHLANAFVRHLGQAGPDGVAVFYYSGHGTQLEENLGLTAPVDPEADGKDEALYIADGSVILDDELGFLADQLDAQRALLIIDACYSGTISRGADVYPKAVEGELVGLLPKDFIAADISDIVDLGSVTSIEDVLARPQRHVLMAASSEDQLSWAIGEWPDRPTPASVFTYYFDEVAREMGPGASFQAIHREVADRIEAFMDLRGLPPQDPQVEGTQADASIGQYLGRR